MGWFRRRKTTLSSSDDEKMVEELAKVPPLPSAIDEAFIESVSLTLENDEVEPTAVETTTPFSKYDASDSIPEDLLDDADILNFTHADEIIIEDVSLLDDPLAYAQINGDLPTRIEFEEE